MRTEQEIREEIKDIQDAIKNETFSNVVRLGIRMWALKWVLEEDK